MSFEEPCKALGGKPLENYSHTVVYVDVITDGMPEYFPYRVDGMNGFGCRQVVHTIEVPIRRPSTAESVHVYAVAFSQKEQNSPRSNDATLALVFTTRVQNYRIE